MDTRNTQRGGVLILVLIGVAIFAALSYAVSQGLRLGEGTTENASRDKAMLDATSVLDFAHATQSAVQEMKVEKGDPSSFDFVIPGDEPAYSTAPHTLKVFHPQGGGVTYIPVWEQLDDPAQATTTEWNFISNSVENIGSTNPELLITLVAIPEKICSEINRSLIASNAVPSVAGNILDMFKNMTAPIDAANCASCVGRTGLCVENGGLRGFYFVLDRG